LNRVKNLIQNERWVGCRPSIENGCSSWMKAKERATCAGNCWHVSESVQQYSVQYKGYNLIGVTTVGRRQNKRYDSTSLLLNT
jgi:hypothetical protein